MIEPVVKPNAVVAIEQQVVERMDDARRALEQAKTLSQIKHVHDGIASVRDWLSRQQRVGLEVINQASLLKLEAEARMGDLLSRPEMVRMKAGQPKKESSRRGTILLADESPSHKEIGIPRQKAKRYRDVASVGAADREKLAAQATQEGRELTQAEVLKFARRLSQPKATAAPALPADVFNLIYADPPWQSDFRRGTGRDVENHYPTMSQGEISQIKVGSIAAHSCILFLWATSPMLPQALDVLTVWGFTYKSSAVWVKSGMGMGYYFRQDHELLLIATKGNPGAPEAADRLSSVVSAEKARHSEKPAVFREIIEQMYPNAKRLEMFARDDSRPGWTFWGNEIKKETNNGTS